MKEDNYSIPVPESISNFAEISLTTAENNGFGLVFAALNYYCQPRGTGNIHCKKELAVFPSPAGMSLIKLFLGGNNLVFSRPERV
jgi:hypothetical protein